MKHGNYNVSGEIQMEEKVEIGILDLPPDVIVHIFKFIKHTDLLFSVRKTCQLWEQLSMSKSLWRTLNAEDFPNYAFTPKSFLELLREVCESLEALCFDLTHHNQKIIKHEGILCSNLKEICIGQFRKSLSDVIPTPQFNNSLLRLSEKYPNLTKLRIVNQVLIYDNIFSNLEEFIFESDERLEDRIEVLEFLQHHEKLRHIALRGCILSVATVTKLLTGYDQLETLDVSGSMLMQDELNCGLILEDMKVENLRTLNLNGTDLVDGLLEKIAKKAKCLEYLNVAKCPRITNSAIEMVAKYSDKLKHLIINNEGRHYSEGGFCDVTGAGLERIAENCHNLTVLKISDCPEIGDYSVAAIIKGCPDLSEFEVSGCLSLQDVTVLSLVKNCVKIRRLSIGNCPQLTGKSVSSVLRYCKYLKDLDIETCNRVTDLDLVDTQSHKYFEQNNEKDKDHNKEEVKAEAVELERYSNEKLDKSEGNLHVHDVVTTDAIMDTTQKENISKNGLGDNSETFCLKDEVNMKRNVTKSDADMLNVSETNHSSKIDQSMQYLEVLRNCCHVSILNLSFCSGITNSCIKQLAWHCPDLRELNIAACYMVTNAGVRELVKCCRYLRSLNISGGSVTQTSRLTDDCLSDIVKYGKNLKELIVQKNYNISADGVLSIVQNCENINLICVEASQRSNLSKEMLIDVMGLVKGKTVCLQLKAHIQIEIKVMKDAEFDIGKRHLSDNNSSGCVK